MPPKKAYVITPFGNANFGNRLQNYATQILLEKHGMQCETLILQKSYPWASVRWLAVLLVHKLGLKGVVSKQFRKFQTFNRNIKTTTIFFRCQLSALAKKNGVFIFGSDQIWHPEHVNFGGDEYGKFLGKVRRRISIAASFGVENLPESKRELVSSELKKFGHISVREKAGQNLVSKLVGEKPPVIIDPTLALSAQEWRAQTDLAMIPKERYVLVCLLGDPGLSAWEEIQKLANSRGLKMVSLMRRDQPDYFSAGPQDFLSLIDCAEIVITDSFHGVIFSLLFGSPAVIMPRVGGESMNSRFVTLQNHFGYSLEPLEGLTLGKKLIVDSKRFEEELTKARKDFNEFVALALAHE
jgi:hypothetical protein